MKEQVVSKNQIEELKTSTLENQEFEWHLCLYVAGHTPKSVKAIDNLKHYCEKHLAGKYKIEVIDLIKNPQAAEDDQVLAIPTLIRKLPEPTRQVIGDLSNEEKVLVGLNINPVASTK